VERDQNERGRSRSYVLDVVVWALWAVLVWGFLGLLAVLDSPTGTPGLHEVIILAYFLGFSAVFALIYLIAAKKGA
jgi:ABC-type long-subunit fatty acid transport system fused permease/ATPase subunit